ncbi:MAG TPA: hypothetical protein DCS80_05430 [Betaproteobacteria bacterium]|jgi:glycerol-1-phosphate dehydrogenase [NAD(P)+]|nr:hypothetical protein [Betaproteobacteria bacterium]
MTDLLDRLLSKRLPDPDGTGMLSVPIRSIVIDQGLARSAFDLIKPLEFGSHIFVICDPNTRLAMGESIIANLRSNLKVTEFVLPETPHPDVETIDLIMGQVTDPSISGVISVGSGSICDLGKMVSHKLDLPYAVFGTAPSMNAYTSVNASITEHGHKKTLAASAARGVFLDLDVLAAAPHRLIASGFADSICRTTTQTDWLAAHLILGKPYRAAPFMLLREEEDTLVNRASALLEGDVEAIRVLAKTLVFSGLGMTICGGSDPASQGEHLIAHVIDMLGGSDWPLSYHGEQIAVTTLTCSALQERLYQSNTAPLIKANKETKEDIISVFGRELGTSCWNSFKRKMISEEAAVEANKLLTSDWPGIRSQLNQAMRPVKQIRSCLEAVKAPTSPGEIGVPNEFYKNAIVNSRLIRDRFTCLDFASSCGILEHVANETVRA